MEFIDTVKTGFFRRMAAALTDYAVCFLFLFLYFYLYIQLDIFLIISDKYYFSLLIFLSVTFTNSYFFFQEWIFNGKTLGKWLFDLRAIDIKRQKITLLASLLRNFSRSIIFIPPFFVLSDIVILLFSGNSRRLGDYISHTAVITDIKNVAED